MKETETSLGTQLGILVGYLVAVVPSIIFNGYALTILWGWFITPSFGLPVPSIPMMIGISMVLAYLTHQNIYTIDDRDAVTTFWSEMVKAFLKPALALGIGYIVHSYV